VQKLLHDRARTSVVVVSLAEEMPANEARELQDKLALLGLAPEQLVVNQVYPNRFPPGSPQAKVLATLLADPTAPGPLVAMAQHGELAHSRRALNERYLAQLSATVHAPLTELPLLFVPRLAHEHIELLSKKLEQAWAP
jgi:anion-transporting  ArsA/GET3 family ATPase